MRLGILADIHEHVEELRHAIAVLERKGADRFVILGDVFETGKRIEETISLLESVDAIGVWGNHDFGLCCEPSEQIRNRFCTHVLDFMARLQPRLEVDGCLFTHVEPWLDPHNIEDLWYFGGPPDSAEKLARSFSAVPDRILFMGHMHRWLLGAPGGVLPWSGERPLYLDRNGRYLVVVHAVWDGSFALFDTDNNELIPFGRG
jgi:Calcineurin-like phosphoesterase superfamily domain